MINKTKGFSLVEVIIALGILTAGALMLARLYQNQAKAQKATQNSQALYDFISEAKVHLARPEICTRTFNGKILSNGAQLDHISGLAGTKKYWIGQDIPESTYSLFEMKVINLISEKLTGAQSYRGEFQIEFTFKKDNNKGRLYLGKALIL